MQAFGQTVPQIDIDPETMAVPAKRLSERGRVTLALGPVGASPAAVVADPTTARSDPTTATASSWGDRSPESLAVLLVRAAERLRTDPDENVMHCAVRGAAAVLRTRLDERLGVPPGVSRDAAEGP